MWGGPGALASSASGAIRCRPLRVMDNELDSVLRAYVNHGGIGFLVGASGSIDIPVGVRTFPLHLVAPFASRNLREVAAPVGGWSHSSLVAALEADRALVLSFAPVDAFLGTAWIGSTEV